VETVVVDELVQFSVQGGSAGGGSTGGVGISPAVTVADRLRASREIASAFFIGQILRS
jgi:hypothetical protein